ncbi:MAG: hypothetical protein COV59_00240 [Candidatus Magasanikbacteria bacterium CG11_big_fil_rev_8_21_14_0_20_39_34]|uniref:GGDEF domain-containing protein n=1 Tax=Candidatus Magasanikbacteria bacterium CG11_big_fil_rev_8_21_14_0_20_39_34 TaxID=1974653 RepID=A0A2H0N6M4_9BACT|nr:MAG: hypothetical protein COV59_00240 [Candidatus Magasanikbacteria bacterium CG11_big_fil_rev_8_21_14_0_20_39_34]
MPEIRKVPEQGRDEREMSPVLPPEDLFLEHFREADREEVLSIYNELMRETMKRLDIFCSENSIEPQLHKKLVEIRRKEIQEITQVHFLVKRRGERDELTGLLRRGRFSERFNAMKENMMGPRVEGKTEEEAVYCFIDMDFMKKFNDTYGHEVVDRMLELVGKKLESQVRLGDAACRHGGDEFTLLLTHMKKDSVERVMERIYKSLSSIVIAENPDREARQKYVVLDTASWEGDVPAEYSEWNIAARASFSLGVRKLKEGDDILSSEGPEGRIREQADGGAYATKKSGRGGITYIDGENQQGKLLGHTVIAEKNLNPGGVHEFLKVEGTGVLDTEQEHTREGLQNDVKENLARVVICAQKKNGGNTPRHLEEVMNDLGDLIFEECYGDSQKG